jgi:glycosyltransferase involved in cell wall biosynthesis
VLDRIPPEIMTKIEEVFVFDDASQDRTFDVAKAYQGRTGNTKLVIKRNPTNLMYGGNQRRGYQYAIERQLDIVVLLHGDGQYAPEVMQRLLTPLEEGRAEMVMGSRMQEPGAALRGHMPLYKYAGNRVLTRLQNQLLATQLSEFHSGYRAYSVPALASIPLERLTTNWHFDTQIILEFLERGYRIEEVPIPTYYGDEVCHVNGIPYAYECLKASALFAWQQHTRARRPIRPSQRTPE